MRRIHVSLLLAVIFAPIASSAGDKDKPRSLAAEAAYLAEKGGVKGWLAEEVTFTKDEGKKKAKGKLHLKLTAAKDTPTGFLSLIVFIDSGHGPAAVLVRGGGTGLRYALVEKNGKRYIKIMEPPRGPKKDADPKVIDTLEYSIKSEELTVKPGAVLTGAGWDLNLTKAIVFKPAKEWWGVLKDEGLRKRPPAQIDSNVGYVADAKAWEKLWTAWRGKEALPKVDFARELVVVVTVSGSNHRGAPVLPQVQMAGAKGDLRFNVSLRKVGGPGFGYYLAVHSWKDIKTICGKPIAAK